MCTPAGRCSNKLNAAAAAAARRLAASENLTPDTRDLICERNIRQLIKGEGKKKDREKKRRPRPPLPQKITTRRIGNADVLDERLQTFREVTSRRTRLLSVMSLTIDLHFTGRCRSRLAKTQKSCFPQKSSSGLCVAHCKVKSDATRALAGLKLCRRGQVRIEPPLQGDKFIFFY